MGSIKEMSFDHLIGHEVGTSTLLKELGRGAMAVVFVAYQRTLKRQIAVKVLPKTILTPEAAALFQQEAEMAAILSHPNIIQIYEVGSTDEFLYFTMQLIQGKPLSYFITRAKKNIIPSKRFFPTKTALKLIIDILDGLAYAHSQDVVHRDIKPSNILIEGHGKRPVIMDFGISKSTRDVGAYDPGVIGTPTYIAPEQIMDEDVDGRADIYAMGIMLFQMLVEELPIADYEKTPGLLRLKVEDRLFTKKPSELNPTLNEEMDRILFTAMARDPNDRYADCREFSADLQAYAANFIQ